MKHHLNILILGAAILLTQSAMAAFPKYMTVTTPQGRTVTVTALDGDIIKVSNTAPGQSARRGTASVLDESSDGELLNPGGKGMTASVAGTQVTLRTDGTLTIDAGPGKSVTDSGVRTLTDGKQEIVLSVNSTGSFYGAGERGHKLNLRGDTLVMYNRQNYGYTGTDPRISQMNITMPLFLASDGYAIVFDDFAPAELILSDPIKYITESPEPVNWYFINGANSLADVSENLARLTGHQELPPLWSMGYITSKYGYHDRRETEGVIDTLKTNGYPVDGLVLDLYWYGKEQDMGRLEWDPQQWPDAAGMLKELKERGVNVVTISQPYILRNGKALDNYNYLKENNLMLMDSLNSGPQEVVIWVGEGGMFDVANPNTRKWLSNRYESLTDLGVAGWWGDLGEPEVHPQNGIHANGLTARQYHNRYGNDWSSIIYDLYKEKYPDTRLLSMMRGGTTGLQRYDVFPWSTDVSRSWGGLEPQVRIMLNSGLSGMGYMGHDVGGFAVGDVPVDPELYVRWLQLGLFSPMLRTHAQFNAEPYHYPEYEDIIKPLIKNRYRWMPYNYTLAWENATKGYPLVRPLSFHAPLSSKASYDSISDQFLWGRDVLVAPVMTQGATARDITLPEGTQWVDFYNPTIYYDGATTLKDYPAPLDKIPLFIRAGAFIPSAEYPMENVTEYNPDILTVNFYPAQQGTSSYSMFEDDFTTPSARSGNKGLVTTFTATSSPSGIEINIAASGQIPPKPKAKEITLVINNQTSKPGKITVNGHKKRFTYDSAKATVTLNLSWKPGSPLTVNIKK